MIETGIELTVYPEDSYQYVVSVSPDSLAVSYREDSRPQATTTLAFGSKEEMIAVARAMLRACEL